MGDVALVASRVRRLACRAHPIPRSLLPLHVGLWPRFRMLRTLLTPLSSRFSATFPNTPHTVNEEDDVSPEDFARDVLIELMRNSIARLKDAQDVGARLEVLDEILRVAQQDACTKDVFREMDGFLVLVNLFTTVDIGEPPTEQILEQLRLAFAILSAVLKQHATNMTYFRVS